MEGVVEESDFFKRNVLDEGDVLHPVLGDESFGEISVNSLVADSRRIPVVGKTVFECVDQPVALTTE